MATCLWPPRCALRVMPKVFRASTVKINIPTPEGKPPVQIDIPLRAKKRMVKVFSSTRVEKLTVKKMGFCHGDKKKDLVMTRDGTCAHIRHRHENPVAMHEGAILEYMESDIPIRKRSELRITVSSPYGSRSLDIHLFAQSSTTPSRSCTSFATTAMSSKNWASNSFIARASAFCVI